jgi:peptidoglycan glycosyltransferase
MCVLFLSLIGYLSFFAIFQADRVQEDEFVIREKEAEKQRGKIYDKNGIILAESIEENGQQVRVYPYRELYAHVIGYHSNMYGNSGLESTRNSELTGGTPLTDLLKINRVEGDNIKITIDHSLQVKAAELLQGRKGAVVAMNPATGAILAMYSNPSFDPNEAELISNFEMLTADDNAPFLSRVNHGLYPPASTFKIITATALINNGVENLTMKDEGKIEINNHTFHNYGGQVMGELNLKAAFTRSSNVAFCFWGSSIGSDSLQKMAENFGFNHSISSKIEVSKSRFPTKDLTADELAASSIGQGKVLATPLEMCYTASIVAEGGWAYEPYLVDRVVDNVGNVLQLESSARKRVIDESIARKLQDYMISVVQSGTATGATLPGIQVAGKTGTAENETESDHAWFVGYAPAAKPEICVAVIIENTGQAGAVAAVPVAKELMSTFFNNK